MSRREEILKRLDELLAMAREMDDPELLSEIRDRVGAAPESSGIGDSIWDSLIGKCEPLMQIRTQAQKFANAKAPILITGESGTGKDVLAKILHGLGPRAKQPFISENCAAIPVNLLESVLFGHKKGAFTGAIRDHDGHFVAAHGGTLLLDEIGDMPLAMQAKLLRVLQEGELRPVGGTNVRSVDVRVIAATNQDLEKMVAARRFREDLYYRLNVLRLYVPPLRDRGEDILLLARHFLASGASVGGHRKLDPEAEAALLRAPWPGNVRQLQNEMQRAMVLSPGPVIRVGNLSDDVTGLAD